MGHALITVLDSQKLLKSVGVEDTSEDTLIDILGKITGITKTKEEVQGVDGGKFCITYDTLLKIVAIYTRLRCNIPVILMGECGCGKTALLRYVTNYLDIPLISLDIHGGTTAADITAKIDEAEAQGTKAWVFLDEINTCNEMGLLTEILVKRCVNGRRISENVSFVAALNPYRRKKPSLVEEAGLVFQLHSAGGEITPDPMADLVYKVHPIPGTLLEYCFDYGALTNETEMLYIDAMLERALGTSSLPSRRLFAEMISAAQTFVRTVYAEMSVVSLRDVQRAIDLLPWFTKTGNSMAIAEQKQQFEEAFFTEDASGSSKDADNGPYVKWLQSQTLGSREKVAGEFFARRSGVPEVGTKEEYVSYLEEIVDDRLDESKRVRLIQIVKASYPKWAGDARTMSPNLHKVRDFKSVTVTVSVTAPQGITGTACEIIVVQAMDPTQKSTADGKKVFKLEWGVETEEEENAREKTVEATYVVPLEQSFALIAAQGICDGGRVAVQGILDDANDNIRVEDPNALISTRSMCLALAHVYYYRLNEETEREGLLASICAESTHKFQRYVEAKETEMKTRKGTPPPEVMAADDAFTRAKPFLSIQVAELGGSSSAKPNGVMWHIIDDEQETYIKNMFIERGIARNKALKENLFVVITCILNRIPVMVVGKPGTSKTLCMQLIQENLRGGGSKSDFWKPYPTVNVFPYQCSPLSTAAQIQKQYDSADTAQSVSGKKSVTVLLLDEIGLAEFSPDMPLKVLHKMLMSKTVAIVGISNWMLDPAKMNRAVCLRRPDPPQADLNLTGAEIIGVDVNAKSAIMESGLAAAYHTAYVSLPSPIF